MDQSQKTLKSNEDVDGYDAMVIFLAKMMPRSEQSATVSNANIEEGGFELTDGQDAVNRCWGSEVNHFRSLDGLAV